MTQNHQVRLGGPKLEAGMESYALWKKRDYITHLLVQYPNTKGSLVHMQGSLSHPSYQNNRKTANSFTSLCVHLVFNLSYPRNLQFFHTGLTAMKYSWACDYELDLKCLFLASLLISSLEEMLVWGGRTASVLLLRSSASTQGQGRCPERGQGCPCSTANEWYSPNREGGESSMGISSQGRFPGTGGPHLDHKEWAVFAWYFPGMN